MENKKCTLCNEVKPVSEFYLNTDSNGKHYPRGRCKNCDYIKKFEYSKKQYARDKEPFKARSMRHAKKLKLETMLAYGGVCSCCGENRIEFLVLDHINGDGGVRRKSGEHRLGANFYFDLRKRGFPKEGLQVLCHNCNSTKGKNKACSVHPKDIYSRFETSGIFSVWSLVNGH